MYPKLTDKSLVWVYIAMGNSSAGAESRHGKRGRRIAVRFGQEALAWRTAWAESAYLGAVYGSVELS